MAIQESQELWQSSYGPAGSVFAVAEGAKHVPGVQQSSMGRAKVRSAAVIFETALLPDVAFPEEVMWHVEKLPIRNVEVVSPSEAIKLLDGSIPVSESDQLKIPLHPAFNIFGDWTRMPEDFEPWIPGQGDETYMAANQLWHEDQDVELMRSIWNDSELAEAFSPELLALLDD